MKAFKLAFTVILLAFGGSLAAVIVVAAVANAVGGIGYAVGAWR
jgi:hypothetical protein